MESLWQDCLLHFERELPNQQFQTWFKPLELLRIDHMDRSCRVVLGAPTRFKQNWAKNQFFTPLSAWWSQTLGTPVELEIEVFQGQDVESVSADSKPVRTNNGTNHQDELSSTPPIEETTSVAIDISPQQQSRLTSTWTFETFVPGKANQLARAAALQVADNPGRGYNPLFLYGGVGLGKSHLIHAVGNSLLARNQNARVRYIHAEAYVSDVVKAYQRKSFDEFKRYYHSLDLLLIDDIQFFAGKQPTQE